jgi:peptidoglycan hydrolase CwlO-like protein
LQLNGGTTLKKLAALLTAGFVTSLIAFGMLLIGLNAFFNPNSVPASDSANDPAGVTDVATTDAQTQINQLQSLIAQYQDREKQYQAQIQQYQNREKQYQTQTQQLNTQVQQLQNVLSELQRRGIIRIQSDGTIQLRVRGDN